MVVLGLDTATWTAAVGVARDDTVLAAASRRAAASHVRMVPALIDEVLAQAGLELADVDAVAVSIGPGSFTGLRIGLGLAKGLCYARGLALVAVPTLEALAHVAGAPAGATVCAALDARRRECWAALFRVGEGGDLIRLGDDFTATPDDLAARLPVGAVVVGDAGAAYADALAPRAAAVLPADASEPSGGIVARLGARRLARGERAEPGTLEPTYVRPPDAQLPHGASR
ncbi:MAG: tRNA (adenosine(37)-N6)-threonylcarbamoyltransferase complex dimerization subunit type 1 TsaB [bacterium]|nr:tRNA (adenosine(37)-N6)-threonylcarbamoyltransferase complex dimerization subunit type 1 TsaB [bacterium]